MAKADLLKKETAEQAEREVFGGLLRRVQTLLGLNRDEMADELGIDASQLGRWYSGKETPQVWRYHRKESVRDALRLAEALDAKQRQQGISVRTVIEMVR
jgi:transcriptional regulator with XRE-family HTH domain